MATLSRKLSRILRDGFPPPAKIIMEHEDQDGLIGRIVSKHFAGRDMRARVKMIMEVVDGKLTSEEKAKLLISPFTPEEQEMMLERESWV